MARSAIDFITEAVVCACIVTNVSIPPVPSLGLPRGTSPLHSNPNVPMVVSHYHLPPSSEPAMVGAAWAWGSTQKNEEGISLGPPWNVTIQLNRKPDVSPKLVDMFGCVTWVTHNFGLSLRLRQLSFTETEWRCSNDSRSCQAFINTSLQMVTHLQSIAKEVSQGRVPKSLLICFKTATKGHLDPIQVFQALVSLQTHCVSLPKKMARPSPE